MALDYSTAEGAESESILEHEGAEALEAWRAEVLEIPRWAQGAGRSIALEELVRWYERICTELACADQAPLDGLDALTDELTEASSQNATERLARARWAVRVAEELAHWRACRIDGGAPARARVASSRLELALKGTRPQFGDEPPSATS